MPTVPTVSIRDLANNASSVVSEVARSGRPAIVTRHGKPVVALVPIAEADLEDWVLANADEFVRAMAQGDADIAAGRRGRLLEDVADELARPPRRRRRT